MVELSSFQIDLMPSLKPDAGILTNITPDHLDRHGTMENYVDGEGADVRQAEARAIRAIIGVDDEWGAAIASRSQPARRRMSGLGRARARSTASRRPMEFCVSSERGREIASIDLRAMPALKGAHNWQNAAMAYGGGAGAGPQR